MTDQTTQNQGAPETGSPTDDTFAWTEPDTSGETSGKSREWLTQLQSMIENLATQAAPVVREVGAKAAELAALAGDKAGPVAQKAAEIAGSAGQKVASKSRDLATELRRDAAAAKAEKAGETVESAADEAVGSVTTDEPTTSSVA